MSHSIPLELDVHSFQEFEWKNHEESVLIPETLDRHRSTTFPPEKMSLRSAFRLARVRLAHHRMHHKGHLGRGLEQMAGIRADLIEI